MGASSLAMKRIDKEAFGSMLLLIRFFFLFLSLLRFWDWRHEFVSFPVIERILYFTEKNLPSRDTRIKRRLRIGNKENR